ncbi:MAG: acyl-CoA thioesterase [Acidobacteriota bacterium]|nr:acyl-CoA thioesterase [Acidobacteriota bacterium]
MKEHEAFELAITVQPADIDGLGHVNNVVYVRWIQDVAIAHWSTLATAAEQQRLLWVITRHEIDYLRPAFAGDDLIARTWVGEAQGMSFPRHTELVRRTGRKVLARAKTLWCPVDAKTLRPMEPGAEIRARFSSEPGKQEFFSQDVF